MAIGMDIIHQIALLENRLRDQINSLPDNPKIKRINHNCFILKSSDLRGSWAPEYHDFKCQYKEIINILSRCRIESIDDVLQKIIKTGSHKSKDHTFKFNPKVLEYLQLLTG